MGHKQLLSYRGDLLVQLVEHISLGHFRWIFCHGNWRALLTMLPANWSISTSHDPLPSSFYGEKYAMESIYKPSCRFAIQLLHTGFTVHCHLLCAVKLFTAEICLAKYSWSTCVKVLLLKVLTFTFQSAELLSMSLPSDAMYYQFSC